MFIKFYKKLTFYVPLKYINNYTFKLKNSLNFLFYNRYKVEFKSTY